MGSSILVQAPVGALELRRPKRTVAELEISDELLQLLEQTDGYYRTFDLAKKSGGVRKISAPSPDLCLLQAAILKGVLYKLPVNRCAKAYVPGTSLRENARFHIGQKYLLKADIRDFFGSIRIGQVRRALEKSGIGRRSASAIAEACCFQDSLPQGAPTSGYLSNLVLNPFDRNMFIYCRERGLRYTRYSDDISISGAQICVGAVMAKLRDELARHGLELNRAKCKIIPKSTRQLVTGLVVNERVSPGRGFLRELRQQLHYVDRFGLEAHAKAKGFSTPRECVDALRGKISFAGQILGNVPLVEEWNRRLVWEVELLDLTG